jgi:hypothetical protein
MSERDLNELLTENQPGKDALKILGEDFAWALRALLIEKSGPNLRNRLCHGLLSPEGCCDLASKYLLCVTLKLVDMFK